MTIIQQYPGGPLVMTLWQGADDSCQLTFTYTNTGNPVDLTGLTLTLRVQPRQNIPGVLPAPILFSVTGVVQSPATNGVVTFTFLNSLMTQQPPGNFYFDISSVSNATPPIDLYPVTGNFIIIGTTNQNA